MNKKQILKTVIFLCGFVLLLQTVTYVIRTNGGVKDRFTGFYAEDRDTLDVVMIGSSPVYPCYAGAKIWGEHGITCYPVSSNMQGSKAALPLVREVRKTQNPELFVFEMKQFTADEEDLGENYKTYTRGVTDNMKYSLNRVDAINRMVKEKEERYTYYFDIFKYHSNWKTIIMPSQLACFRYERLEPLKGFEFKSGLRPVRQEDYSKVTASLPLLPENDKALRELLAYLQDNHLKALFILTPYAYEFKEKQENFNYMEEVIHSYGYDFLNLNDHTEEMEFDFATDFYDGGVHTNSIGAEKCTEFFAEYLTENFKFTDKRGNTAYQSWDDAYRLWTEQMEQSRHIIEENIKNKEYTVPEEEGE